MLFRCYPQFIVEGVVPDLFRTKVRWVQQTPSGLESPHWHACAVEVWHNVLRVGWVWGGELSVLRISDWPLEIIFLLNRAQTGFRPGANTLSVSIISIRPSFLFLLDSSPFSSLLLCPVGPDPLRFLVFLATCHLIMFGWWMIPARVGEWTKGERSGCFSWQWWPYIG